MPRLQQGEILSDPDRLVMVRKVSRQKQFHLLKSCQRESSGQPITKMIDDFRPLACFHPGHGEQENRNRESDPQRLKAEMGPVTKEGPQANDVAEEGNADPLGLPQPEPSRSAYQRTLGSVR